MMDIHIPGKHEHCQQKLYSATHIDGTTDVEGNKTRQRILQEQVINHLQVLRIQCTPKRRMNCEFPT